MHTNKALSRFPERCARDLREVWNLRLYEQWDFRDGNVWESIDKCIPSPSPFSATHQITRIPISYWGNNRVVGAFENAVFVRTDDIITCITMNSILSSRALRAFALCGGWREVKPRKYSARYESAARVPGRINSKAVVSYSLQNLSDATRWALLIPSLLIINDSIDNSPIMPS